MDGARGSTGYKCQCRFWLCPEETHCRNCGTQRPEAANREILPACLWVGAVVVLGLLFSLGLGSFWELSGPIAAGAFIALPVYLLLRPKSRLEVPSLREYHGTSRRRIQEVGEMLDRLEAVHARVKEQPASPQWDRVRESVRLAHERYVRHLDGYRLILFEVDLARWENALQYALQQGDGHSGYQQTEERLKTAEYLRTVGKELLEGFDDARLSDVPGSGAVRDRIARNLEACEALNQALIAQQAAALLSGVDLLHSEPMPHPALVTPLEPLRVAEPFERLEAEHARLLAQKEVADLLTANASAAGP